MLNRLRFIPVYHAIAARGAGAPCVAHIFVIWNFLIPHMVGNTNERNAVFLGLLYVIGDCCIILTAHRKVGVRVHIIFYVHFTTSSEYYYTLGRIKNQ